MLRFCLVVDCERFLSFKQGNPRWNRFEKFKGKMKTLSKEGPSELILGSSSNPINKCLVDT